MMSSDGALSVFSLGYRHSESVQSCHIDISVFHLDEHADDDAF